MEGYQVCVVNPLKTRNFAKSAGFLAKTDNILDG
jgi:transposase